MQACKPRTCPASRPKEEASQASRDINDLMDGGAYMSKARSWSSTLLCADDMAALFAGGRGEGVISYREN